MEDKRDNLLAAISDIEKLMDSSQEQLDPSPEDMIEYEGFVAIRESLMNSLLQLSRREARVRRGGSNG